MGNKKTLDLEPIITSLCYRKNETLTETQIKQAINEAILNFGVEYVTTLPTGSNIKQKVYITPDTTGTAGKFGDIYVYDRTNSKWVHVDALKFDITDYATKSEVNNLLSEKATVEEVQDVISMLQKRNLYFVESLPTDYMTVDTNGLYFKKETSMISIYKWQQGTSGLAGDYGRFEAIAYIPLPAFYTNTLTEAFNSKVDKVDGKGLSTNDYTTSEKNKLNGIETGATKTVIDSSLSSTSTNPVQNKVIQSALSNKADNTTVSSKVDKDEGASQMTDNNDYSVVLGLESYSTQQEINQNIVDNIELFQIRTSANFLLKFIGDVLSDIDTDYDIYQ